MAGTRRWSREQGKERRDMRRGDESKTRQAIRDGDGHRPESRENLHSEEVLCPVRKF